MAARNLVVDTNIFIEYLRSREKHKTTLYSISSEYTLYLSSITLYELYMGATTDEKITDVTLLTEDLTILPFNDEVAIKAAAIYRDLLKRHQAIEFRDIFIGATCIVYDLPLKTTNKKHFSLFGNIKLA